MKMWHRWRHQVAFLDKVKDKKCKIYYSLPVCNIFIFFRWLWNDFLSPRCKAPIVLPQWSWLFWWTNRNSSNDVIRFVVLINVECQTLVANILVHSIAVWHWSWNWIVFINELSCLCWTFSWTGMSRSAWSRLHKCHVIIPVRLNSMSRRQHWPWRYLPGLNSDKKKIHSTNLTQAITVNYMKSL